MINIETLSEKDINRQVIYKNRLGKIQEGRITSWNHRFIFVDFYNKGIGLATNSEDLEFLY